MKKAGEKLVAAPECAQIKNKIWDGQALLDESVFQEYEELRGKGMALLRNRFFKTCAFHTKLQKWFRDQGITELSQLHPRCYTEATCISDIKLVVTDVIFRPMPQSRIRPSICRFSGSRPIPSFIA